MVVSAVCDILRAVVMERMRTLLVVTVIPMVAMEAEHGFLGEAGEIQSRTFPALLLPHQVNHNYDRDYLSGGFDDDILV